MKIGSRYTPKHHVRTTHAVYEEVNAPVQGHAFDIQSALIGKPKPWQQRRRDICSWALYWAALGLALGSAAAACTP